MESMSSRANIAEVAPEPGTKRSVGRPRHYDEATERELVFEAAYRVLRDNRDNGLTIADVLAEAGVSTRSFYRHFASKDELLCAMYLRDGERAAERLTARVQSAASPRDAVRKWIDEIFTFHEGPRAERFVVLASITAVHADGAESTAEKARALLIVPLTAAIAAGNADGTFRSTNALGDADLVAAAVFHAAAIVSPHLGQKPAPGAKDEVVDFCFRALGVG